jgi:hypothetical protein
MEPDEVEHGAERLPGRLAKAAPELLHEERRALSAHTATAGIRWRLK